MHAGGPSPSPPRRLLFGGWRRLGCARLCGLGYLWNEGPVIGVSNDIDCDHQAQRYGQSLVPQAVWKDTIMESFRTWGLQGSRVEASPSESCFFGDAVMSLVADKRICHLFIARVHSEREGTDSTSSGSVSLPTWVKCGVKGIP